MGNEEQIGVYKVYFRFTSVHITLKVITIVLEDIMANTGETRFVDLQDERQELTMTDYLSEDLKTNWSRVWKTHAYNVEDKFHEGKAYTEAKKHLWYTGGVTLCGYPGEGKTCTAEHLVCNFVRAPWEYPTKSDGGLYSYEERNSGARERKKYFLRSILEKDRDRYSPVFVSSPQEYRSQLNPKEHQIFVIDDIFGEACLNQSLVELWRPHLEDMMVDITANRPRTLVVICVNKAHLERAPEEICRMDWFKKGVMIDFTSTHALDKLDQKELILRNALSGYSKMDDFALQNSGFFDVKESAGLVYRIYNQVTTFKMEGPGFFRSPWRFIQETIDKIYRFDKIFYYTMAVATLLDGNLDLSKHTVSEYDPRTQNIIRELIPLLNVPEHVTLSKMRFAAKQLTGVFFQPTDQWKWRITHPKIYQLCVKSLYNNINKHLVKFASKELLLNYIRTMNCGECQHELSVKVARESYEELASKYIYEILSGNMKHCVQSPCFTDPDFVKIWLEQIIELHNQESVIGQRDCVLDRSLFYWACYYGQGYVVQGILQSKEITFCSEDWFQQEMKLGLYVACASNSVTSEIAVKCLLQHGVDVTVREVYEEINYGKVFSQELCYLMFLEAPLIHVAARFGHPDSVKLLLDKGENHSVETKDGLTPLHRAASRLDSAAETVVETLIKQGADLEAKSPKGRKPIHEAVTTGNTQVVSVLVKAGATIKETMEDGQSFLSVAVAGHHKELADYLVIKGADVNGSAENNFSPLQHAIHTGNINLVDWLISNKGADVNKVARAGMGALHLAVLYQQDQIVEKLIAKGADVNLKGIGDQTPLHIAAKHGLYGMCDVLIAAGAKPEMMTANLETALVLAAQEGHQLVVWLLLKEGMELEGGGRDSAGPFMHLGRNIGGPFMGRDFYRMFHQ